MRVVINPVRAVVEAHVFKRLMRECGYYQNPGELDLVNHMRREYTHGGKKSCDNVYQVQERDHTATG